jgi:hypothetical protein
MTAPRGVLPALALALLVSCRDDPAPRPDSGADLPRAPDARGEGAGAGDLAAPDLAPGRWVVVHEERFEGTALGSPSWIPDPVPDDGPFSDHGIYFKDVTPPNAHRLSQPIGAGGWLTVESSSRSSSTAYASLVSVVEDPSQSGNKVLRLRSPSHTDATVIRSTHPLPARYRISLRVGHAQFGDGAASGTNGYTGGETAEPWGSADATAENGFYWAAILDAVPRPHNNVWIHHHRKLVVDSDNHHPPWMEIWDGSQFISSGAHPIMLFAVDGEGQGEEETGKPFLSYAAGAWQPSGEIRALDAYQDKTWYTVTITRDGDRFSVSLAGDFAFGGTRTYSAEIDAAARCVFHFNRTPLSPTSPCLDLDHYPSIGAGFSHWPPGIGYPDYLMIGDPHSNYYEGQVLYDDLKLEVWQ